MIQPPMQDASQPQSIQGVFTPRLVARLCCEGFDGTVRFNSDGVTRVLYFRRGDIASAASNAEADRLPSILIADGRLTGPQLEMAKSRLSPGASLGKTLIDMGFLTPAELLQGARRQVRQILSACFALTEGTCQVSGGPLPPEVTVLGLPSRRLLFDALLETGDRQAIVREMGSMESTYRATPSMRDGLAALKLDPAHDQVAGALVGSSSLRSISSRTSLDDFTVSRIVLALEILGLAEREEPAATDDISAAPSAQSGGRRIPVETEPPPLPGPMEFSSAADAEPAEPFEPPPPSHPDNDRLEAGPAEEETAPVTVAVLSQAPEPLDGPDREPDPDETLDDLPPLPSDELPAFARPDQEPPAWQVDPVTGGKVYEGPIEMTFDGHLGPKDPPPASARRYAALAGITVVVLVSAVAAFFLRRPERGAESPSTPALVAASDAAGQEVEKVPRPEPDPRPTDPGPPDPEQHDPEPPESSPAPVPQAADHKPPPVEAGPTEPLPRSTPPTNLGWLAGERAEAARRLIEAGQVERAAAAFRGLVTEEGPNQFTLQVMIACEPATIRKALAATRASGGIFIVPYTLQGRPCYRACHGTYRSRDQALAAASDLPAYFSEAAARPVVVSFGRLAPPR